MMTGYTATNEPSVYIAVCSYGLYRYGLYAYGLYSRPAGGTWISGLHDDGRIDQMMSHECCKHDASVQHR